MSLMVFDDSKIDKIKQRNQKGFQSNVDVVEASKEAKGGSELIYARVKERVPAEIWDYFQVILVVIQLIVHQIYGLLMEC